MKRSRLILASITAAGPVIVGVLAAQLALALREKPTQHRRLAALEAAHKAQQPSQWGAPITIAVWNLPQPIPLDSQVAKRPSGDPPAQSFIVPVPPEVDEWIFESRVPVTDEKRSRWIPFEFDGVTYFLVPV